MVESHAKSAVLPPLLSSPTDSVRLERALIKPVLLIGRSVIIFQRLQFGYTRRLYGTTVLDWH